MTPTGIEPATFRFVAQHLNHCAAAVHCNATERRKYVYMYAYVRAYRPHITLNIVFCAHLKRNAKLERALFLNAKSPSLTDTHGRFGNTCALHFQGRNLLASPPMTEIDCPSKIQRYSLWFIQPRVCYSTHDETPLEPPPKGDEPIQHRHISLFDVHHSIWISVWSPVRALPTVRIYRKYWFIVYLSILFTFLSTYPIL